MRAGGAGIRQSTTSVCCEFRMLSLKLGAGSVEVPAVTASDSLKTSKKGGGALAR